ncbi:hypothetical protein [Sporosarcina sp. ITBMC105]
MAWTNDKGSKSGAKAAQYVEDKKPLIEQSITDAATAKTDADRAKTAANAAVTDASNAVAVAGEAKTQASEAKTISSSAKTTAETVQSQFDQVVAEAGSNNPEVVQARGGEVNLNARLDKVTQQLTDKENHNVSRSTEAVLIGCQEDETFTVSNATHSFDSVNYKVGSRGHKLNITGAVTAQLNVTPAIVPQITPNMGAIGIWIYLEDASKVRFVEVSVYASADSTIKWEAASNRSDSVLAEGLKNGWNHIRWHAAMNAQTAENLTNWGTVYKIRVMVTTSDTTSVTVGKVVGEVFPKAQILFVEDAQYRSFYNTAYQDLKARNIPVTWALRISTLGTNIGQSSEQLTESEIIQLSKENNNSISFHSFDGQNSTMTPTELRIETMKALKWLSQRGYSGRHWRAAFLQNNAPAHASIRDLVPAYSMPVGGRYILGVFPFLNRYNTPRIPIHNETKQAITDTFAKLKKTHQLYICYTHGVADNVSGDITHDNWKHFISEVDKGLSEGWLEGVTFEQLNKAYDYPYNTVSYI